MTKIKTIYLCTEMADFNLGYEGMSGLIDEEHYKEGNMFVFCNRYKTKIKIIFFDKNTFHLYEVELRTQHLNWPLDHNLRYYKLSKTEAEWFLEGRLIR